MASRVVRVTRATDLETLNAFADPPPALLREGAGAVVEGSFAEDGTFRATSVIAKHDERYAPPSPGKTPEHQTSP